MCDTMEPPLKWPLTVADAKTTNRVRNEFIKSYMSHLEGLSLALATPDAENQGNLDLGQVQEVLGHVDGQLVQEGGGDEETVLDVVHGPLGVGEVVFAGEDGVLGATTALGALEEGVNHAASAGDVLLQSAPQ